MSPKPEKASTSSTRAIGWSALAAVLALTSLPATAFAQDRENRRGGGLQTQAQPSQNRSGGENRGGGLRVRDSSQTRETRSSSARPQNAPQRVQQQNPSQYRGGGLQTYARQTQNRNVQRTEPVRPTETRRDNSWRNNATQGNNARRDNDQRRDGNWRSNDQRREGNWRNNDQRRDGDRTGHDRRWDNNVRSNDRRDNNWRNNDRRDNDRRDNNWRNNDRGNWSDRNQNRWDRTWRNNNRYNWQSYRSSNRNTYRLGRYYSPYRNYSYRRVGIGLTLGSLFYSNRYWVSDPWQYRLPEVYGPYRWVRYYDDVVLVNTYTGEVMDVIYDFFW